MAVITMREAICQGFREILTEDPKVFLIGVGLSDAGAVFGTLDQLYRDFGPTRMIEAPLSEGMLTGLVHGAALAGMKPVLVHTRINFAFLGMDQIVNHIALWKKMFNLKEDLPIMIRGVAGQKGWGNGSQHLGTYENLFRSIEGLSVIIPQCPQDAKTSIIDWAFIHKKPTIFIDQKELYETIQDVI